MAPSPSPVRQGKTLSALETACSVNSHKQLYAPLTHTSLFGIICDVKWSQAKYCQQIVPLKSTIVKARGPYKHGAHNISYNCRSVNTPVTIQQCVCYSTSSIFKVRFFHFSVTYDLLCHLGTTTYTYAHVAGDTLHYLTLPKCRRLCKVDCESMPSFFQSAALFTW